MGYLFILRLLARFINYFMAPLLVYHSLFIQLQRQKKRRYKMTVVFIPHQERVRQQQTSTLSIPYILIISIFYTFPFSSYLLQHYTFLYRHSVTNFHQTEHFHSFFLEFIFSILILSTCKFVLSSL